MKGWMRPTDFLAVDQLTESMHGGNSEPLLEVDADPLKLSSQDPDAV
jgi:hypothetical protein